MIFSGSLWLVALFRVHVCERPEVGGAEVRQMEEGERVTRKEYRGHKVDKVGGVGLEAVELCVTCPSGPRLAAPRLRPRSPGIF